MRTLGLLAVGVILMTYSGIPVIWAQTVYPDSGEPDDRQQVTIRTRRAVDTDDISEVIGPNGLRWFISRDRQRMPRFGKRSVPSVRGYNPAEPTMRFGRTSPYQPNLRFGKKYDPARPALRFGKKFDPAQPTLRFGKSLDPNEPSLRFGRDIDDPAQETLRAQRSFDPSEPSLCFGKKYDPFEPTLRFGRQVDPSAPAYRFGRHNPAKPSLRFGRGATSDQVESSED
ncbi:FMRFamide-related peptides type HF-4-like [Branchiostoma lanceolatum]|uniref:FMRFamide-related peptides type HF-4-like n=1 Tax=Branchiostoma lanceolatum TaxID=7740 RepID=UPI0034562428